MKNNRSIGFLFGLFASTLFFLLSTHSSQAATNDVKLETTAEGSKLYTYTSTCKSDALNKTQAFIVPASLTAVDELYIFFHGTGNPGATQFCSGSSSLCAQAAKLAQKGIKAATIVTLGEKAGEEANDPVMTKAESFCYYNEAKEKINSVIPVNGTALTVIGHSMGSNSMLHFLQDGNAAKKTIVLDGCFKNRCDKISALSNHGQMYLYATDYLGSYKQAQATVQKNSTISLLKLPGAADDFSSHNAVISLCYADHVTHDNCQGKGTGSTPDAPPPPNTNCSDQFISLAYPDALEIVDSSGINSAYLPFVGKTFANGQRPANAPPNAGLIWVSKEACSAQNAELIIAYHGWRSFQNPGDNVYLKTPDQKIFDVYAREALDTGKVRPLVIAAPMNDRGPHEKVWDKSVYSINTHISKIYEALKQKGITVNFTKVSLIGHSNANCGGGLARAASELQGYTLNLYGAADGTCGDTESPPPINNPFLAKYDVFNTVKKHNAILFHLHTNYSDSLAAKEVKDQGPGGLDPDAINKTQYQEAWRSTDGKLFTYTLTPGGDHNHTYAPKYLLQEVLPRFFSLNGYDPSTASAPQPFAPGAGALSTAWNDITRFRPLTTEELRALIQTPFPRIRIPGLSFSAIDTKAAESARPGDDIYLSIPFLGEYTAAIFKYLVVIIGILSVARIIQGGFVIAIPDGSGTTHSTGKQMIVQAITGLIVAVSSYVILYTINPNLVQFSNLKIKYSVGQNLAMPSEEADAGSSQNDLSASVKVTEKLTAIYQVDETFFKKEQINTKSVDGWPIWNSFTDAQKTEVLPHLFKQTGVCPNENQLIAITDIPGWNNLKIHPQALAPLKKATEIATNLGFKLYPGGTLRTTQDLVRLWNTGVVARYQSKTSGWQKNEGKISSPTCESPHMTGGAVDVNLINIKTKNGVVAEDPYKITPENYNTKFLGDPYKIILEYIFNQAGWVRLCTEHWHFEYGVTIRYKEWDKTSRCWAYGNSYDQPIPEAMKKQVNDIVGQPIL